MHLDPGRAPVYSPTPDKNDNRGISMSDLITELHGGILTLTLSRPYKKNALTNAMYAALADGLERAEAEAAIRVVVFQADGETFSAGNDLGEFAQQSTGNGPAVRHVERFMRNIARARQAVKAAGQGKVA